MIAKMSKLSVLVYHKEYEALLKRLYRLGVVHVVKRSDAEMDEHLQEILQTRRAWQQLLAEMKKAAAGVDEPGTPELTDAAAVGRRYDEICRDLQQLASRLPALAKDVDALAPWGDFSPASVERLAQNGLQMQFFCCADKAFDEAWTDAYNAVRISQQGGQCYFVTLTHGPVELADAEPVRLPGRSLSDLRAEQARVQDSIRQTEEARARFCAAHLSVVEAALDDLGADIDLLEADQLGGLRMAEGAVVGLEGWVPTRREADVRQLLAEAGVYYELRPALPEENAPIQLQNNRVTRLFEVLTRMYGMPDYAEFDPTPLLAPFYAVFFGLCVGDAGYGLLLVALGWVLKRKMSASMAGMINLLITLGAATTLMGALLGTFFGVNLTTLELPQWLQSLMLTGKSASLGYDKTMVLALVVGMFHICFAMTVKAICSTVRYGFRNSLSAWGWWLLVGGSVSVCTLAYLEVLDASMARTLLIGIGSVSAVGIYLLNNPRRNVFVNVGAGLWDTYNMATGLMGDLLSYLRLYALGLAGGMLGGVFNSLGLQLKDSMGDFLFGIPGWLCFGLIFVAGHALNIALSCLSGYVHSIRLTFVEYFKNSGYDGRGEAYRPFASRRKPTE